EIPSTDLPDTTDDVVEENPSTIASQQVGEHEPIVVPLVVESNTPETGKPAADGVFLVTQIDSDSPAPGGSASAETPPAAHGEKQPAEMNARGEPHVEQSKVGDVATSGPTTESSQDGKADKLPAKTPKEMRELKAAFRKAFASKSAAARAS